MATSGFPGCIAAVHSSETGKTVQLKSEHHNEYEQQRVSLWEATHKLHLLAVPQGGAMCTNRVACDMTIRWTKDHELP